MEKGGEWRMVVELICRNTCRSVEGSGERNGEEGRVRGVKEKNGERC